MLNHFVFWGGWTWIFERFTCLICMFLFWLCFKGKVQRLGWFHADIWEALAFWTEHMTSVTVAKSLSFALPASKLGSTYRNLKSNVLLYNLPPCSFSAASNPIFFGTSRDSAEADFKAQWNLGPLELLCQSMRGSMCPCCWGNCWGFGEVKTAGANLVGICWHFL